MVGIVVILLIVSFSGCTQDNNSLDKEKNKFVGIWYKTNYLVMDLNLDGTCSYLEQSGTWDLKDGKLVLELSSGLNFSFNYAFSDSDLTLKLTSTLDGSTTVYTKRGP